jgi:hypothetical protein
MSAVSDGRKAARTTVEIPSGRGFADVAVLVIGGVAARFELPVDRVDDLLLALDSLLMQDVLGETVRVETDASPTTLAVRVGPFPPGRLDDGGLRRVLSPLVDTVSEVTDGPLDGASIELVVTTSGRDGS